MIRKIVAAGLAGATLGSALMLSTAATAQDAPRMPRDPMLRGDTNADGIVTREELLANVDKHFAARDANKDGKIGADEGKRRMRREGGDGTRGGRRGERGLARIDTDKDGAISLAEQRAMALRRFDYVDRNGDGKVDQAEREALRDMMMGMRGHGGRGHHGPPPAGAPNAPDGE
jgi:hypothetical protein